ncbi:glycoside hydrolase family 18 protein [Candidatus Falkowbacteria bacterium]|nr:glycoside hydrolase family 18 protein [Candidatus Falkowbacteria bacterium]
MFDFPEVRPIGKQKQNDPSGHHPHGDKNSLRPLILILGFFAIASAGVILFALFQKLGPEASAAPGIYKTLNYQGKLEDVGGVTVADGSYNIKLTIYDAAAAGNVLWTARESDACGAPFNPAAKSVTTSLGVFSTQLGESGDCPINLDFNTDSYYLGVTVGADSEMTPRKRIGAAGYAFNADLLDGLNTSAVGGASAFVPAADSSGNFVLTGNVTFDTNTFALDSTNDNIGIGTAAPDIARTLDLIISKKYGIYASSNSTTNHMAVIYGEATDTTNIDQMGGYFSAASPSGKGVFGTAVTAGNPFIPNYGGYFIAAGDSGNGVYGEATATTGATNYGGYFTAGGDTGYGVYGWAAGTGGVNYGGYFRANGLGGYGVYGWAADMGATGNYGGYFQASGQSSYGVYGYASEATTVNYGVYGQAEGPAGYGVKGYAGNIVGGNYGGYFEGAAAGSYGAYGKAPGTGGYGVYGWASNAGAPNYGGYFKSDGAGGYGVYALATDTTAVTNYGGYFTAAGTTARAVYAEASDLTSINFGGYFIARGVDGGTSGVYGEATAAGSVYGVQGFASNSGAVANYGGNFAADGTGGARGVFGFASNVAGTNYGVYGQVASSAGWGGYFTGGNGLYASRFSIADTTSAISYNTIGAPAATHTAAGEIENASDLFIADDLEIGGQGWSTGGYTDLAEMIAYSGEGEAGDVVVVDENNDNAAKLATKPYDQSVLGIISTKPSLIITGGIKEGKLMAVAGRVPTKVTNVNGAIKRGDLLTTSAAPGRAMKATEPGPIVGKALGECDESECTIWVFLNVSWYGGVRTETTAIVSSVIEDAKNLERENLLTKLSELWQKIVSLLKK